MLWVGGRAVGSFRLSVGNTSLSIELAANGRKPNLRFLLCPRCLSDPHVKNEAGSRTLSSS